MRAYLDASFVAFVNGVTGLAISLAPVKEWLQVLALVATIIGTLTPAALAFLAWKAGRKNL